MFSLSFLFAPRFPSRPAVFVTATACAIMLCGPLLAAPATSDVGHPPIPVHFKLERPGFVTLVVEDGNGNRIRNLVAGTQFPAGDNTVWWDGQDESVRLPYVEGNTVGPHGIYTAGGRVVAPGKYAVRGLVRDAVQLRYEFTVYPNVGTPPWRVPDGTGAWLADHTPPSSTQFVPATPGLTDEDRVYIAAPVAEAGFGLIWTDTTGRKINGVRWVGGHWTGANYLARDSGDKPVPGTILYTGSGWQNDKDRTLPELRINAMTSAGPREVFKWSPARAADAPAAEEAQTKQAQICGLAVRDGLLAVAQGVTNQLMLVRVTTNPKRKQELVGTLLATSALSDARDLAFDAQGRLLVLSAHAVRRYVLPAEPSGAFDLGVGQIVVGAGLEDAHRLALSQTGEVYVSDWGLSHQVKVFDGVGKLQRCIGTAGAPHTGPYDSNHMNRPGGMTVLPNGQLWVAEDDFAPKRVSVWDAAGQLSHDMIGPPAYGGGGWLDPTDKTRFYLYHGQGEQGGGMEFKLDWATGKAKVANIYARNQPDKEAVNNRMGPGPDCPLVMNGTHYLTNAFNSSPTNGAQLMGLWRVQDGVTVPIMAAGSTQRLAPALVTEMGDLLDRDSVPSPKGGTPHLFVWSDSNGDGRMQKAEFSILPLASNLRAVAPTREGALIATLQDRVLSFAPTWEKGVPLYDIKAAVTLAHDFQIHTSSGNGESVVGKNGWTVVTDGPIHGFQNGQQKWYYHNQWPGLHAGHRAPPVEEFPGQLIATTRLLGPPVTPGQGQSGELWGINSDHGVMYLMTMDGLFVAQLGTLDVLKQWHSPQAVRDMDVSDVNFVGESFWPSINQGNDGKIYLVAGKETSSLIRVDGLESIVRLPPQTLDLTALQLAAAETYQRTVSAAATQATPHEPLHVVLHGEGAPMKVDGDLSDWEGAKWVTIQPASGTGSKEQKVATPAEGAVAVCGDRLFLAVRSLTANLLLNQGNTPQELFKSGGGLDLMLQSNGDKRVVFALHPDGKTPLAALYQPVVPGTKPADRTAFSSPWRTIYFDRVQDISNQVQIKVKTTHQMGADGRAMATDQIEASIPLALLQLAPQAGGTAVGDIGILRGDGSETIQRLYWSNKATGLMNDVPGEAQLSPGSWGKWVFETAPATPTAAP